MKQILTSRTQLSIDDIRLFTQTAITFYDSKKRSIKPSIVLLTFMVLTQVSQAQTNTPLEQAHSFVEQHKTSFEENKGQVWNHSGTPAEDVKYHLKDSGVDIFMLPNGLVYQFNHLHFPQGYLETLKQGRVDNSAKDSPGKLMKRETFRMDLELVGANPNPVIKARGKSKDYVQYYNRNALDVHSFRKLTYESVYPGIDWVIYTTDEGLKYDFVVHPGADPTQIKLQFHHHEAIKINADGSFTLSCKMGSITEQAPVSFQGTKEIATTFALNDDIISFRLNDYDKNSTLVIDPSLIWATYYGGDQLEYGFDCTTDANGNVFVVGETHSTTNIASGGHQNTKDSGGDAFIVKFSSSGVRQWATYYGGNDHDRGTKCSSDANGNIFLSGETDSNTGIATGGHQNTHGGGSGDTFLVKFNSNGVRQWATYYGGTGYETSYGSATDNSGNIYLSGCTTSSSGIASGGHQNTHAGSCDAFLVKFNSNGVRQWATYYGGYLYEEGRSIAIDNNDNVCLVGRTETIVNIASGGHQNTYGGGNSDAFLVKFNSSGTRLWGTYYGGTGTDYGYGCAIDQSGNVFLSGETDSNTGIAIGGYQNTFGGTGQGIGQEDAFLVKFNSSGVRQWGTYYGGTGNESGVDCAVDASGAVFMAGKTGGSTGLATPNGHVNTLPGGGGYDAFLAKFMGNGQREWATYYGAYSGVSGTGGGDWGTGCAIAPNGDAYLTGYTYADNNIAFNGHQNNITGFFGVYDAFLAKFEGFACTTITNSIQQSACDSYVYDNTTYTASGTYTHTFVANNGCDSVVTLNLTVNQPSTGTDVQMACGSYTWIDGNTYNSNNNTATHTLTNVAGCDSVVTLNLTITNTVTPNISISAIPGETVCQGDQVTFSATITHGGSAPVYQWKQNGSNVGTGLATYSPLTVANGDVITCELTSSETCVTTSTATSNIINMVVHPLPAVNIVVNSGALQATSGYVSYQWSLGGVPIGGATSDTYTPSSNGLYTVDVVDINGCENSATYDYTNIGIEDHDMSSNILLYPNPVAGDQVFIEGEVENASIQIYDVGGKKVIAKIDSYSKGKTLNVSNLLEGFYLIKITLNDWVVVKEMIVHR